MLLLHYPGLTLDLNSFVPSTIFALDDPILGQNFLQYCCEALTSNGGNVATNMLLSPMIASDDILK